MSISLRRSAAALLCMLGIGAAAAAPVVGQTAASTSTFLVGSTPQVTITSVITDPSVIPASVTLQRINADGSVTNLGVLHDDGLNGDVSFGDRIYSYRFPLTATAPTQFRFRVSAAFRGQVRRSFSETVVVYAQAAATPQQMLTQLADELAANDIEAALRHFPANPRNREKLAGYTPPMLSALIAALRTATLVRSDGPTRVFSLRISNGSNSVTAEIGLTQIPSGEWYVMYW